MIRGVDYNPGVVLEPPSPLTNGSIIADCEDSGLFSNVTVVYGSIDSDC